MNTTTHKLERLFNPRSVAVVGAKQVNNYNWLRNVIDFPGPKYHVNIDEREWPGATALGFPNYKSLMDVPGEVDFVIVAVPAAVVPRVLADCVTKGVKGVHVFTAGFSETGTEEGKRLEQQMIETATRGKLNMVGPNCLGLFNPKLHIGFSSAGYSGESGNLAFISHSGSQSSGFIAEGLERGFKVSKLVSMGNGVVLDSAEYLEYFGQDDDTEAIGLFLEGVRTGRRFFEVARKVAARKPVLVWKVGETENAARATSAHSATRYVTQPLWDSVLRQCGAVRVDNVHEMFDLMQLLLWAKPFTGARLGLICQGGGHATEIANVFAKAGFEVPPLTQRSYDQILTDFNIVGGSYRNPLEGGSLRNEAGRAKVLRILDEDENLDAIVEEFPISRLLRGVDDDSLVQSRVRLMCDFGAQAKKPYAVVMDPTYPSVDSRFTRWAYEQFAAAHIPAIYSFERTAKTLWKAMEYHRSHAAAKLP